MIRNTLVLLASIAGFLAFAHAATSPVVGQWKLTVDTPRGTTNPVLTIKAGDTGYSGTWVGPRGTFELQEIKVDGNTFSFPMTITIPIGTMEMQYSGKVEGDKVSGTIGNPQGTIPFAGERIRE